MDIVPLTTPFILETGEWMLGVTSIEANTSVFVVT